VSLKSGSQVRLKKDTGFVQVNFGGGASPTLHPDSDSRWNLVAASAAPFQEDAFLAYRDTIDISGVSMADLSMVNQGSGVIRRGVMGQANLLENLNVIDMHILSLTPLTGDPLPYFAMMFGLPTGRSITDDRLLMVNIQSFKRGQQDSSFTFSQNDASVYGSASTFSSDKIYVYRLVAMYRIAFVTSSGAGPARAPIDPAINGHIFAPATSFAQLVQLKEFDTVATAYAVYRGNELDQTFDNP